MYEKYLRDIFQQVKKDFQRYIPVDVQRDKSRLSKWRFLGK